MSLRPNVLFARVSRRFAKIRNLLKNDPICSVSFSIFQWGRFSLVSVFFHGSIFKPFTSNFPISHPLSLFRHDASSSDCLHTPLPNPPQINPFLMDKDLSNSSKFKSNMFRRSFLPHLRKSSLTLKLTGWSFNKYHSIFLRCSGFIRDWTIRKVKSIENTFFTDDALR